MLIWVKTILKIRAKLDQLCLLLDERIDTASMSMIGNTFDAIDKVFVLMDFKRRLINLGVLAKKMLAELSNEESDLVELFVAGVPIFEMAQMYNKSKSAMHRKLNSVLSRCSKVLIDNGFTEERLNKHYLSMQLVRKMYYKFKRVDKVAGGNASADKAVLKECACKPCDKIYNAQNKNYIILWKEEGIYDSLK